jgi:xanthine/uracil/vitamin C permease (AzgA family)
LVKEEIMLEKFFAIRQRGSTPPREVLAGVVTFMTMSYILFVQPIILSGSGMDLSAVFVATCLASAIATLAMGLLANYPIALAAKSSPEDAWPRVLGAVFIAGCVFLFLSIFRFRARVVEVIPDSLKHAIAVGIGLLITLVGLEYAGLWWTIPRRWCSSATCFRRTFSWCSGERWRSRSCSFTGFREPSCGAWPRPRWRASPWGS